MGRDRLREGRGGNERGLLQRPSSTGDRGQRGVHEAAKGHPWAAQESEAVAGGSVRGLGELTFYSLRFFVSL